VNSQALSERYRRVRAVTEQLCAPLEVEDFVLQSMPDASPVRWHLAHTTWFFETFLLATHAPEHRSPSESYHHLFNSYYQGVGSPFERSRRGLLSRPTVREVGSYRESVDQSVCGLLDTATPDQIGAIEPILTLGLHHEQQHQELLLTDIKHAFSLNPLQPTYLEQPAPHGDPSDAGGGSEAPVISVTGGMAEVGHSSDGFCFDNELPQHEVWLRDFRIAASPVSNDSYRGFVRDGGYSRPELWLSDGWDRVRSQGWAAPLYWLPQGEGDFSVFTLAGPQELDLKAAVTHLSYYEADAFARWAGERLPTEFEWEHFAQKVGSDAALGTSLEDRAFHPARHPGPGPQHLLGEVWEWTSSAYAPYPGFRPLRGALGEYNGKFMSGSMVLRGGSCVTPRDHVRSSYRNFFAADKRWQFSGLRLAADG